MLSEINDLLHIIVENAEVLLNLCQFYSPLKLCSITLGNSIAACFFVTR